MSRDVDRVLMLLNQECNGKDNVKKAIDLDK